MKPLTSRQLAALTAIKGYTLAHGYPPTLRELAALMGIPNHNGAACHVAALVRKGYLRRDTKGAARTIVLVESGETP